jgi:hypothetical protein
MFLLCDDLFAPACDFVVRGCKFLENHASGYGGAIGFNLYPFYELSKLEREALKQKGEEKEEDPSLDSENRRRRL